LLRLCSVVDTLKTAYVELMERYWLRKTEVLREKHVQVSLDQHKSHTELASAMKRRLLTAWAMERPMNGTWDCRYKVRCLLSALFYAPLSNVFRINTETVVHIGKFDLQHTSKTSVKCGTVIYIKNCKGAFNLISSCLQRNLILHEIYHRISRQVFTVPNRNRNHIQTFKFLLNAFRFIEYLA
jgi:hypothetical protein